MTETDPNIDSNRGWAWIPASLLALGLGAVAMLTGSEWIRDNLISGRIDMVRAVGEVQTRTAIAHLWVEELVTGDDADRRSEIFENLAVSMKLMDFLLDASAPSANWLIEPRPDTDGQAITANTRDQVHRFSDMSAERLDGFYAGEDVSVGSPIDIRYDKLFIEMLGSLRNMETVLKEELRLAQARANQLFRTILAVWTTLVSLAVFGIWSQERRRRLAEAALHASEAQLFQAQKMEAVGRLAGGIAHDINNLLGAITGQCELVKLRVGQETTEERMNIILATANKSATLIRRLLAFGRQQPVVRETFDMNDSLVDLRGMLNSLVGDDIELELDLSAALWSIEMDRSQLEQIILNLTVNAREAMPSGGRLTLQTINSSVDEEAIHPLRAPAPGAWVVLVATDTGIGIAPEIMGHIFEPFFTTKNAVDGGGLGLATIHGIVSQSKGYITVESRPGKGATFRIFLPRSVGRAKPTQQRKPNEDFPFVESEASILLVEDNEELRSSTRQILESLGYAVTTASDADQALLIHSETRDLFDLVITDVIMPGMDGKQLADKLRTSDPDLPVLFVSGYTDDIISARDIDYEGLNFLPKPFSATDLRQRVAMGLSRRPAFQRPEEL